MLSAQPSIFLINSAKYFYAPALASFCTCSCSSLACIFCSSVPNFACLDVSRSILLFEPFTRNCFSSFLFVSLVCIWSHHIRSLTFLILSWSCQYESLFQILHLHSPPHDVLLCCRQHLFDVNSREALKMYGAQCKAILAITQQSLGQRCRAPALQKMSKSLRKFAHFMRCSAHSGNVD